MSFRSKKQKDLFGKGDTRESNNTISIPYPIRKYSGGRGRQASSNNPHDAMRRVFSIFSFSGQIRRNTVEEDDALIFDDKSEGAETDSVLSDNSLTTFGDLDEQEAVGTLIKTPEDDKNMWNKDFQLGFESHATKFLYRLLIEPQKKDRSQESRSIPAVAGVRVDTKGSNLRSSKFFKTKTLATSKKDVSATSLLSTEEFQLFDIEEDFTEILKLDLYSVIYQSKIGKMPSMILTDLFWAAFGLSSENEVKVSDAHLILRYLFQEVTNETKSSELCFQLFNTSRTGILSLKEINEFVIHACSQSLDALSRIPAAKKLFKRYMKYEARFEHYEFFLCMFPFVRDNSNNGLVAPDIAKRMYKLYFTPDAAFGLDIPESIKQPVNFYFEQFEETGGVNGVAYDVFIEAYGYVKNELEKTYLPKFVKKIKRSNRLATKVFQSINASPIPGLEYEQFRKLLRVCPPLKEHCLRCIVWLKELAKHNSPGKVTREEIKFNDINTHILKRRIPM